jgi:hypothetical protein
MKKLALPVCVTGLFCFALTVRAGVSVELRPQASAPPPVGAATPAPVAAAPMPAATQNATIKQYCLGCHNDNLKRGELSLASFDAARAGEDADTAEKIVRKLRLGMMPPKEAARKPDAATRLALVSALETTLDASAAANPNPGRRTFQRLNRPEYTAAIRSLFGLDIDVDSYLPADTISASFDNIADVQMPSATVMQGYMRTSRAWPWAIRPPTRRRRSTTCRGRNPRRDASTARRSARAAAPSSPTTSPPTASTSSSSCSTASRPGCSSGAPSATSRWRWRSTASAPRSSRSIAGSRNRIPRG